jgi:hypothetical protein
MAKFFLHLRGRSADVIDDEGIAISDLAEARETAIRCARDLMATDVREGFLALSHRIEVCDESGAVVLTVPFEDAITIER